MKRRKKIKLFTNDARSKSNIVRVITLVLYFLLVLLRVVFILNIIELPTNMMCHVAFKKNNCLIQLKIPLNFEKD